MKRTRGQFKSVVMGGALVLGTLLSAAGPYQNAEQARVHAGQLAAKSRTIEASVQNVRRQIESTRGRLLQIRRRGPQTSELEAQLTEIEKRRYDSTAAEIEIQGLDREFRRADSTRQSALNQARSTPPDLDRFDARITEQHRQIKNADDLMTRGLAELRSGYFCSQCNRPASQIEAETKNTFAYHLRDVNGEAIPASPEIIARKSAEFRDRVDAEKRKLEKVEEDRDKAIVDHQTKVEKLETEQIEKRQAFDARRDSLNETMQREKSAFEREQADQVSRLTQSIKSRRSEYEHSLREGEQSIRKLERQERELKQSGVMVGLEHDTAVWNAAFYGRIEREAREKETREIQREAEQVLREARKEERLAEIVAARAKAKPVRIASSPRERERFTAVSRPKSRPRIEEPVPVDKASVPSPPLEPLETNLPVSSAPVDEPTAEQAAAEARLAVLRKRADEAEARMLAARVREAAEPARVAQIEARFDPSPRNGLNSGTAAKATWQERWVESRDEISRPEESETLRAIGSRFESLIGRTILTSWDANLSGKPAPEVSGLDQVWMAGKARITQGVEVVRARYRVAINDAPSDMMEDVVASEAPELMGRISEVVNKAERRLSWRNLLKGELLDETRGAIIKAKTAADYKQRTGNDFEDLSEFEQATERVFGNSRIITPPRDYMERLLEAYTQTADRYAVEFGFSDESKELDED